MRTVLLDTVGLLALWDESDQWSSAANDAFDLLRQGPVRLIATTLVLYECGNAASRRPYRDEVSKLWIKMEKLGNLVHPTHDQLRTAWSDYARRQPGAAGIVDLVSFSVMREYGAAEAFTNDAHFRAEGFSTLFKT